MDDSVADATIGSSDDQEDHGVLLGIWARYRREELDLQQNDVSDRMTADLGIDIDPNWITQLETKRKRRMVPQPYFGALCRALRASEEFVLRECELLSEAPLPPLAPPSEADQLLDQLGDHDRDTLLRMMEIFVQ